MTKNQKPFVSIIISTYNRPDMLNLTLSSYAQQLNKSFEVIIANDGSGPETTKLIQQWKANPWFPLDTVAQESRAFRKARIVNKAARQSQGSILIFSDQDCVVPCYFVEEHVRRLKKHDAIFGSRKWIPRDASFTLLNRNRLNMELIKNCAKMNLLEELFRFIFEAYGKCTGCNMAFRREIFFDINGFNSDIEGYGAEDVELGYRLIKAGYRHVYTYMKNPVYHLWHERNVGNIPHFNKNAFNQIKNIILGRVKIQCENGLNKIH